MIRARKAVLALAAVAAVATAVVAASSASPAAGEHGHDRLGVRRQRRDGAVRRSGARDGEDSRQDR